MGSGILGCWPRGCVCDVLFTLMWYLTIATSYNSAKDIFQRFKKDKILVEKKKGRGYTMVARNEDTKVLLRDCFSGNGFMGVCTESAARISKRKGRSETVDTVILFCKIEAQEYTDTIATRTRKKRKVSVPVKDISAF